MSPLLEGPHMPHTQNLRESEVVHRADPENGFSNSMETPVNPFYLISPEKLRIRLGEAADEGKHMF